MKRFTLLLAACLAVLSSPPRSSLPELGAAPLPFAKPAPPPVVPGAVYLLHWIEREDNAVCGADDGGIYTTYTAVFRPDGRFEAWGDDEACFAGRWRVEDNVLFVKESYWHEENECLAGRRAWRWEWSPGSSVLDGTTDVWLSRVWDESLKK